MDVLGVGNCIYLVKITVRIVELSFGHTVHEKVMVSKMVNYYLRSCSILFFQNMPFVCYLCTQIFKRKHGLMDHLRGQHGVGKPFVCEICGASFTSRGSRRHHSLTCKGSKSPNPTCSESLD